MEMLDLPHIWAVFIAIAVMLYVAFDGYDLGIGMLTAYAFSDQEHPLRLPIPLIQQHQPALPY